MRRKEGSSNERKRMSLMFLMFIAIVLASSDTGQEYRQTQVAEGSQGETSYPDANII